MDERLELLHHAYETFNRGDPDLGVLHPEIRVLQTSELLGTAGVFEGHEGFRRCWEELLEGFNPTRFEPQKSEELPDGRILVRCRWTGKGVASGVEIDAPVWHVWTFRDGLCSQLEAYPSKRQALAAASHAQPIPRRVGPS